MKTEKNLKPITLSKNPVVNSNLDIQVVPINSIHLNPKNARINERAVEPLSRILSVHGQRSPVVVWRKNRVVYKGNTTLKALQFLKSPVIRVQFEDFESEAAAEAYGIADNKGGEFSDWDYDVLLKLLSAEEMKFYLPNIGFSSDELKGLKFEADIGRIQELKESQSGISATVKIHCRPEDRDAIRDILVAWGKDSGFEGVVVK